MTHVAQGLQVGEVMVATPAIPLSLPRNDVVDLKVDPRPAFYARILVPLQAGPPGKAPPVVVIVDELAGVGAVFAVFRR